MDQPSARRPARMDYKRIATEEAWCPSEMIGHWKKVLDGPNPDPGFVSLIGFYMSSQAERPQHIMRCLTDLGAQRLRHMDEAGLDRQVIALTSPGVQVMDADFAADFAIVCNDELARVAAPIPIAFPEWSLSRRTSLRRPPRKSRAASANSG